MLRVAMRLGRVGAWSLDVASGNLECTAEARAIHELPEDFQVSPATAAALVEESSRPYIEAAMDACISTGQPFDLEARAWTFHRKPLWIRLIGEAVQDESGAVVRVHGAVQDITDLTKASEEARDLSGQPQGSAELAQRVRERTTELERANRELREFAQALAHDVRGPVAAISAFAKALERDLASGRLQRAAHYVDRILKGVQRVNEYTDALLSLIRLSHVKMNVGQVDLSALAQEILGNLRAREPKRDVIATVEPNLRANGDSVMLRMVLQNLLGNAWKFTSKKKHACISFTRERGPNGIAVYQVRDNGAGFDMAHQSKLFTSFQRLHNEDDFPGTGIGLANVQRIISRHGGRVWAEGVVSQGATFSFTLGTVPDSSNG